MRPASDLHRYKGNVKGETLRAWQQYLLFLLTFMGFALGVEANSQVFGEHPGYLSDVEKERHTIDVEVVLIDEPAELSTGAREIFDEKLTKEFREQFEYRFGVTELEQSMNSPGRTDEYLYFTGQTVSLQEYQNEQRRFGEYMGRRLVEHHVDHWAKSSPKMKAVYELKDKVTNLDMEVQKGYKVKVKYSLSGGHLDFNLDNPYDMDAKLRVETSNGNETIVMLGGQANPRWRLSGMVKFNDGIHQMVATRRLTNALSLSLTGSVDTREEGLLVKQDLFLIGFVYTN